MGLAQALLHDPPVLILDEPTDGLDPNQKHEVRTLINEMSRDKIIVISTHILEEVDAVCSRAIIIARGKMVADDTPQGLATRSRYHNAVSLRLEQPEQLAGGAQRRGRRAACGRGSGSRGTRGTPHGAAEQSGRTLLSALSELARPSGAEAQGSCILESGRLDEVFRTILRGPSTARLRPPALDLPWVSFFAVSSRVTSLRRSPMSSSSSSWCSPTRSRSIWAASTSAARRPRAVLLLSLTPFLFLNAAIGKQCNERGQHRSGLRPRGGDGRRRRRRRAASGSPLQGALDAQ